MEHEASSADRPRPFGWATWLATGLGVGFSPVAPGTVGTLWGLPLAYGIQFIPGWPAQAATIGLLLIIGIPLCTAAARELRKKDPGEVVFDEIATLPITFFQIPIDFSRPGNALLIMALGFAFHRLFDISKIPPAKQLEGLPNGLGIMADDVAAGLYSQLALRGCVALFQL